MVLLNQMRPGGRGQRSDRVGSMFDWAAAKVADQHRGILVFGAGGLVNTRYSNYLMWGVKGLEWLTRKSFLWFDLTSNVTLLAWPSVHFSPWPTASCGFHAAHHSSTVSASPFGLSNTRSQRQLPLEGCKHPGVIEHSLVFVQAPC